MLGPYATAAFRVAETLRLRFIIALALPLLAAGCATFRSYDAELRDTVSQASGGNLDGAIKTLQSNNRSDKKDLLYYFELGELLRMNERYPDSQKEWGAADRRVQVWEETAKTDPSKLLSSAASYVLNDKLRPYEGHDYEKVMLTTRMALNFLALGDYENARVAIKQTHEREAVIAELRATELAEVEKDAQKRGARTSFKELNGYPVQTIDNPAVNALKNSYQSALSHYLAGFVYEALDEPSLAAPGYRLANELQPNHPLLEEALSGLDQRVRAPDDGLTDVLFVVESGTAPARESRGFPLPIPVNRTLILIPVSFPVMEATSTPALPAQLDVEGGGSLKIVPITNIDLMARRALQDEMPGIMLRAAIRSTAKAIAQYQLQQQAQEKGNALLGLAALAVTLGSVVTESADERTWRTLPAEIAIARGRLPRGTQTVTLQTREGPRSVRVDLSGRHAVVGLRLLGRQLYVEAPEAGAGEMKAAGNARPASTVEAPAPLEERPPTTENSK
jgi:uncharacterized protein